MKISKVTTARLVKKIIEEEVSAAEYTLVLNEEEASAIKMLVGMIGGNYESTIRKITDPIYNALHNNGVQSYKNADNVFNHSYLIVKESR